MARTGRPKIKIDRVEFEKLCAIFCTEVEIAGFFECSLDTLNRWCKRTYKMTFADIYSIKSSLGKVSLRRTQFKLAQEGDFRAAKWLGQQVLGQSDKVLTVNETNLRAAVAVVDKDELRKANDELESEC